MLTWRDIRLMFSMGNNTIVVSSTVSKMDTVTA